MLDGRFEVRHTVARGGMSNVFLAQDLRSGRPVAIKVFREQGTDFQERFVRESAILAELRHPAVVRLVDRGFVPDGRPYLAMEWVEGRTLRDVLRVRRLTVPETLRLLRRVAEGLSEAHRRGIVHRDLKPGNLMVGDREPLDVKILDFGLASLIEDEGPSPLIHGTPGYISPEQAKREEVTSKSDIFSLGCIAYECLTQSQAFHGMEPSSTLTKVVVGEPEPLARLRPNAPGELVRLVERMLSKSSKQRPNTDELLTTLEVIRTYPSPDGPTTAEGITLDEQRLTSVFVVRHASGPEASAQLEQANLSELGISAHLMPDGTTVGVLESRVGPMEAALRGIRGALALVARLHRPRATVGIGQVRRGEAHPTSGLLDDAFARLEHTPEGALSADESVAMLASDRFELASRGPVWLVESERSSSEEPRPVLGRIVPLIGRGNELDSLQVNFRDCIRRSVARLCLCTGESGLGKSRLLMAFAGEPIRHGALIFRMRGEADRMIGLEPWRRSLAESLGVTPEMSPEKWESLLTKARMPADAWSVVQRWLTPSSDLETADPVREASERRNAWANWLDHLLSQAPVVLLIDDVQFFNAASQDALEFLLHRFEDWPLFALAAGPASVENRFNEWVEKTGGLTVRLDPLPDPELDRLVEYVLGDACDGPTRRRIIDQAQGNPFVLEELLRAVARGEGDRLPQSVLGLVQARLMALSPLGRQILRAGSVFGRQFWKAGVLHLTGLPEPQVRRGLEELVRAEVIRRLPFSDTDEPTFRFRQSLLQQASYELIPDPAKKGGHARAAGWLAERRLAAPQTIAEHWEQAGLPERAVAAYREAAEAAIEAFDLDGALEMVRRCRQHLSGSEPDADRAALCLVEAEVRFQRGEFASGARLGQEALEGLEVGSTRWLRALLVRTQCAGHAGRVEMVTDALARLDQQRTPHTALEMACRSEALVASLQTGNVGVTLGAETAMEDFAREQVGSEPMAEAFLLSGRAACAWFRNDISTVLELQADAARRFREAGDIRRSCEAMGKAGFARITVGEHAEARTLLNQAHTEARQVGLPHTEALLGCWLGSALGRLGQVEDATEALRRSVRTFRALHDRRNEGRARSYLASTLRKAGQWDLARTEAERAADMLADAPQLQAPAIAMCALLHLDHGEPNALESASEAHRILEERLLVEDGEMFIRLVFALCLRAEGREAEAQPVLQRARDILLRRARALTLSSRRTSYLVRVPENAKILALARRMDAPRPSKEKGVA